MSYTVFVRTWWKKNSSWPGGREPGVGRKTVIGRVSTESEAREMAQRYNMSHSPGFLSKKAEYESN